MKYWISYVVSAGFYKNEHLKYHEAKAHDFPAPPTEEDIKKFQNQLHQELSDEVLVRASVLLERSPDPSILEETLKRQNVKITVTAFTPLREA